MAEFQGQILVELKAQKKLVGALFEKVQQAATINGEYSIAQQRYAKLRDLAVEMYGLKPEEIDQAVEPHHRAAVGAPPPPKAEKL